MNDDTKLPAGLYSRNSGKRTSFYTKIDGATKTLGFDRIEAERQLAVLMGTNHQDSITAMCRAYIAEQRRRIQEREKDALKPATVDDYEIGFEKHVLPVFGHMRPREFKTGYANKYLDDQKKLKRGVRANREMASLTSAFHWGSTLGLVDSNPCSGYKRNAEFPRRRKVSIAEFNAFMAHAKAKGGSAYLVGLIGAFVGLTGRRRGEILQMPLAEVTASGLRCKSIKNRAGAAAREYLIEWSPLLRQLFAEIQSVPRRVASMGFMFANHDGQAYTDPGFKCLWNKLMHSYAPLGTEDPNWFHAHDLRAFYVSEMLHKGQAPNTHAQGTGTFGQREGTMERVYDRREEIRITPLA